MEELLSSCGIPSQKVNVDEVKEAAALEQLLCVWQPPTPVISTRTRHEPMEVPGRVDELMRECVKSWQIDAWEMERVAGGKGLSCMLQWLFQEADLLCLLCVTPRSFCRFCDSVQNCYHDHPYHNSKHVASVVHLTYKMLTDGGVLATVEPCTRRRPLILAAAIIAAAMHDADHQGFTNDFLCRTKHHLAIKYHLSSCNEHHHVHVALQLVDELLASCVAPEVLEYIHTILVRMILASDMTRHEEVCLAFRKRRSFDSNEPGWPTNATVAALQMVLKCADLGHLSLPRDAHLCWVNALQEELHQQGKVEERLGLQVSPLCDKSRLGVIDSQPRFFDQVALPMFQTLSEAFPGCHPILHHARENRRHYMIKVL